MQIYNPDNTSVLDVVVDDTSYRQRTIMGEHSLTLRYALPQHVELPVGSYCEFQGQRYILARPADFKKVHSRNYEYTVTFQTVEYKARQWKFRNPVDGRLQFSLTATPREHLQMVVDNLNQRESGWSIDTCIEGTEVTISYDHDYCYDALSKLASELKTEFWFSGKQVNLGKLEVAKDSPLPLSYGRGKGFKTGVGRANSGDSAPTEILYVQGGSDNIDKSKYPPYDELGGQVRAAAGGNLLLPRNAELQFDGQHFEGETGFNASAARTYITDNLGLSIRCKGKQLSTMADNSLDCSNIYPKRVGEVKRILRWSKQGALLWDSDTAPTDQWPRNKDDQYDIIDPDIPDTLDYSKCMIGEQPLTIRFQSGMLAGREFDVNYFHEPLTVGNKTKPGRRFEIISQEIDGVVMPGDCFEPGLDNKYAIFNCMLPQAYINAYTASNRLKQGAEWDMFREAVRKFYDMEQPHFTFTGTLDGIWAKQNWGRVGGKLVLGGFVQFNDAEFAAEGALVRIMGIKDYINNPHAPEITLSNDTTSPSLGTTLLELATDSRTANTTAKDAVRYTRRRFQDAQQTMAALEQVMQDNFSESISPVGVRTMQMLVGDESLQFEFVNRIPAAPQPGVISLPPIPVDHNVTWNADTRRLVIPAGIIRHMTIDVPKDITAEHSPTDYRYWRVSEFPGLVLDDAEPRYVYVSVNDDNDFGVFACLKDPQPFVGDGVYNLLIGILNREYNGQRSFAPLYGYTEILPGRITTDRVISADGNSFFDMANNALKLGDKLQFNIDGDQRLLLQGSLVQSPSGTVQPIGCFRGRWASGITYYQGDEVTYTDAQGVTSTYRYIHPSASSAYPPTDSRYWLIVAQGVKGQQGFSPAVVYRGEYDPNTTYLGTAHRVEAVRSTLANGAEACFVTRPDAGQFKGVTPTNATKWNPFGATFDSVATKLLLADNANIANMLFRNERLESQTANADNIPNIWIDGKQGTGWFSGSIVNPYKRLTKDNIKQYLTTEDEFGYVIRIDFKRSGLKLFFDLTKDELVEVLGHRSYDYQIEPPCSIEYVGTELNIYSGKLHLNFIGKFLKNDTFQPFLGIDTGHLLRMRCIAVPINKHLDWDTNIANNGTYYIVWEVLEHKVY